MAPINRYAPISEKQFNLYTPPMEFIGAALESAQKTYDRNFMFANELKNKYLNALPQDRARANEIQTDWEKRVDDLVKTYNGDYSQATKDLYLLQKDIEKQYKQGGEAFAIEYNYQQMQDSMKRNKERLAKGDIKQVQYQALYDYVDRNYQGAQRGEDGTYQTLSIPELASYVDTYKASDEATKNLKPRTKKITKERIENGRVYHDTEEFSFIDPQEVEGAIQGAIMSNEGYINYVTQLGQLTGQDPKQLIQEEFLANYNAFAPTRSGYFNIGQETKSEADPFELERRRYQHQRNLEGLKHSYRMQEAEAKGEIMTPDSQPNMQLIANVATAGTKYKPLGPNGIQSPYKKFGETIPGGLLKVMANTFMPGISSMVPVGPSDVPIPGTSTKGSVDYALKNPKQFTNINIPLLSAIKQANPKFSDEQIIEQYDRSIGKQQYGEGVYVDAYRNSDTGEEAARLIVPQLRSGTAKAYFVDAAGNQKELMPEEVQSTYSKLWDTDKNKPRAASVGTSMSFSGQVPLGEVFPMDGGYLVVSSNNEEINQYNDKLRKPLFDFITDDRVAGDVFNVLVGGKEIPVRGIKEPVVKKDEQGLPFTTFEPRYVALEKDKAGNYAVKKIKTNDGQEVPDYFTVRDVLDDGRTVVDRPAGPYDMERKLTRGLRQLQVPKNIRSKSSESNTSFE